MGWADARRSARADRMPSAVRACCGRRSGPGAGCREGLNGRTSPWCCRSLGMQARPAANFRRGEKRVTSRPAISMDPAVGTRSPVMRSTSSDCPLPSTPAIPRTSPGCTSSETSDTTSVPPGAPQCDTGKAKRGRPAQCRVPLLGILLPFRGGNRGKDNLASDHEPRDLRRRGLRCHEVGNLASAAQHGEPSATMP